MAKRAVDKLALLQDGVREDSVVSSARVLTVDFVDNAGADHPTVRNQSKGNIQAQLLLLRACEIVLVEEVSSNLWDTGNAYHPHMTQMTPLG